MAHAGKRAHFMKTCCENNGKCVIRVRNWSTGPMSTDIHPPIAVVRSRSDKLTTIIINKIDRIQANSNNNGKLACDKNTHEIQTATRRH